jgi:hypothetical protein
MLSHWTPWEQETYYDTDLRTDLVQGTTRPKNKTWINAQIKNYEKREELKLIRPQIQHKNPEHKYLKFITTLTPSVRKL